MKYGCISDRPLQSFSPEIHAAFGNAKYEMQVIPQHDLPSFLKKRPFCGINVTLPYKQTVLPFLDFCDDSVRETGVVNTVMNRNGRLYGSNTDIYGLSALFRQSKTDLCCSTVAILGSGATAKTAAFTVRQHGAKKIYTVSRTLQADSLSYTEIGQRADVDILINTTPCGMAGQPVDFPSGFSLPPRLRAVFDVIYNPLCTTLCSRAKTANIPAAGGLYMLVAQAARSEELFDGISRTEADIRQVYHKLLRAKTNLVLIGMGQSGKTTVGRRLATILHRPFWDTDACLEERFGLPVTEIFARFGETAFRTAEAELIRTLAAETGCVIATGGGGILNPQNRTALRTNGKLIFLDRPPEKLTPDTTRPLYSSHEAIERLYKIRYPLYKYSADKIVSCYSIESALNDILDFVNFGDEKA